MATEKYMAGFVDADGYIGVRCRVGARPDIEFQVSQRVAYRDILDRIADEFGGQVRVRQIAKGEYAQVDLRGGPAVKAAERLAKYAVMKGPWMRAALDLVRNAPVLKTREDVQAFREQWKALKREASSTERNYPSRKWLAGYFDGDGSFSVKVCSKTGYAYPTAAILAEPHMASGIRLLEKAFGGRICTVKSGNLLWQLPLSQPSKIKQFVGFFAQHLQIKKAQAYYLLNLADGGNLRDGVTIQGHMKGLNAQQHRLSDPASVAAEFTREVNFDITAKPVGRPKGVIESKPRLRKAA